MAQAGDKEAMVVLLLTQGARQAARFPRPLDSDRDRQGCNGHRRTCHKSGTPHIDPFLPEKRSPDIVAGSTNGIVTRRPSAG